MYNYPHIINNGGGEEITFLGMVQKPDGLYMELENRVQPGSGPPMHVHFRQDEALTVIQGKMATQILGEEAKYHAEGDSAVFKRGIPHKFWNNGDIELICRGWVSPIENMEYFLTEIYRSTAENGGKAPSNFDAAFLMTRYKNEFDMNEIPGFVKKVIFPITVMFGKLAGKHKRYADAPAPVK